MKTAAILAVAGVASIAAAQSATVGIDAQPMYTPGETITVTINLDYADLPSTALGLAGWNIAVDVSGGTVTGAAYLTATAPLTDQNDPFFGDPAPDVNGNTVNFSEGLNAFGGPVSAYHTGGALATITIDTTGAAGDIVVSSRLGDSALGAFTYGEASPSPAFAYVGTDFSAGTYGSATIAAVPAPASMALLGLGGLVAGRRRR